MKEFGLEVLGFLNPKPPAPSTPKPPYCTTSVVLLYNYCTTAVLLLYFHFTLLLLY